MAQCDASEIVLNGDLSIAGVKEQYLPMMRYLTRLDEDVQAGVGQCSHRVIDLTGVQEFDACGCQMLAVFLRNLRHRGVAVFSFKLSDAHRETIHRLGFDEELFAGECA